MKLWKIKNILKICIGFYKGANTAVIQTIPEILTLSKTFRRI